MGGLQQQDLQLMVDQLLRFPPVSVVPSLFHLVAPLHEMVLPFVTASLVFGVSWAEHSIAILRCKPDSMLCLPILHRSSWLRKTIGLLVVGQVSRHR